LATASSPRRRRKLKQSVYEYSFTPVNLKDINAFAQANIASELNIAERRSHRWSAAKSRRSVASLAHPRSIAIRARLAYCFVGRANAMSI
jgi:hypothetical protein